MDIEGGTAEQGENRVESEPEGLAFCLERGAFFCGVISRGGRASSGHDNGRAGARALGLDIGFKETEPPAGVVEFIFSAGRALRLEVECLEAEIRDLGFRWQAKSAPHHPFDGGPDTA